MSGSEGSRTIKRSSAVKALGAGLAAPLVFASRGAAQTPIPVRFGIIGSAGQGEVTYAIAQHGLDKKYGFAVQAVDYAVPGQQYQLTRADAFDVSAGNFVDILRQRKAGLGIASFHGFQGYNNYIVTKPQAPIKTFADLKGKKVGEFGTAFLDWLIIRAAGKKAYNVDLEKDATLVQGAPPLLNQFLARDDVDATLQFSDLSLGPIAQGQQRLLIDVPGLMKRAGFDPNCFYLHWFIAEKWVSANSGALERLDAMLAEAYNLLRSDDSLWPPLAQKIGITDPALIIAYRNLDRAVDDPPYSRGLIAPTQKLVDSIVALAGPDTVPAIDPAAFLFPGHARR